MSSPTGTLAPSVCGLCYRPFCGVARVYMPNCGCYLHTRCFVGFHIWHLNLEYMEAFFDAWQQHHMQGEDKASFRFPRHRKEMYWAELKCKTRSVETWRRQYLTRHACDLWYIFTVRAVSVRAKKVLNLVRNWQRSEWDEWLARFFYLRDKALAAAILNEWLISFMPALVDSSSEGGFGTAAAASPSSTPAPSSRIRMVNRRRKGRRERISAFRHALKKRTG